MFGINGLKKEVERLEKRCYGLQTELRAVRSFLAISDEGKRYDPSLVTVQEIYKDFMQTHALQVGERRWVPKG